jgi:hypothetical protein
MNGGFPMSMIKSALELALERTKNLEVDEIAVKAGEIKTKGRRAAGKYLDNPETADLSKAILGVESQYREQFRKAVFDILIAQIQLPTGLFDAEKLTMVGTGLGVIAGTAAAQDSLAGSAAGKKATALVQQISAFLAKYVEEVKRVEQAIRTQWAPKLKEKERQLAARTGQNVRLDPMSDPEFSAFYKQNFEALRANYNDALERAKGEIAALCGIAQEEA